MIHAERVRTLYLFTVITSCCFLMIGCPIPTDVVCTDLSETVVLEPLICTDGNEPQVCMAPDSDNCGYYVNSKYIPCKSCYDCDIATDIAVALCLGMSRSIDLSSSDQVADDFVVEKTEALLEAMESPRGSN